MFLDLLCVYSSTKFLTEFFALLNLRKNATKSVIKCDDQEFCAIEILSRIYFNSELVVADSLEILRGVRTLNQQNGLRKYNMTFSELPAILKSIPLSSEISESNRFQIFKEAFSETKLFLVAAIFENVKQILQCFNQFSQPSINMKYRFFRYYKFSTGHFQLGKGIYTCKNNK